MVAQYCKGANYHRIVHLKMVTYACFHNLKEKLEEEIVLTTCAAIPLTSPNLSFSISKNKTNNTNLRILLW